MNRMLSQWPALQSFTETPVEVIVKHVCTRWLSLEKTVKRMLSQWPALQSYFASVKESERPGRAKRCMVAYNNVSVKLSYQFLSYAVARLNRFNVIFQVNDSDNPAAYHFIISYKSFTRQ